MNDEFLKGMDVGAACVRIGYVLGVIGEHDLYIKGKDSFCSRFVWKHMNGYDVVKEIPNESKFLAFLEERKKEYNRTHEPEYSI